MSRQPDFFLVGAPKSGTTSMASYLEQHPRAFVSDPKEPGYFARHLTRPGCQRPDTPETSLEVYLSLFGGATADHLAVGEASTRYLRSRRALEAIRSFNPRARIIVILRSPVDLVTSWHGQKLLEGQEDETDFEKAWRLQPVRERGGSLPAGLVAVDALQYDKIGSVGTQLETTLEIFGRDPVHVELFDDLRTDPRACYERVLAFLGLPGDGRRDFPVLNAAQHRHHPLLARALLVHPRGIREGIRRFKRATGISDLGYRRLVDRLTTRPGRRASLSADFRQELVRHFSPEVDLVERLTGRELASWRS